MRPTLFAALFVLALGAATAVTWTVAERDREYRRLVASGEAALADSQTGVAVEAFSGAIALRPDSMVAFLRRGETYQRIGDLKAALRDLKQATLLDPTATRPLERLGDVHRALGFYDRAVPPYAAYVALDDQSPRVLYKLGLSYYLDGEPSSAIAPLQRAIALNDAYAEAHYVLGLSYDAAQQPREAVASLERAVRMAPGLVPAREALARRFAASGRQDLAIEQFEALAALEPGRLERRLALARAYNNVGRTDLAVTTLSRAFERFPDSVPVYSMLGEVWLKAAESRDDGVALNKALQALNTAVLRGGSTSRDLALYGRAQLRAGDTKGAMKSLTEAATKLPVAPETFRTLATACAAGGNVRQARDALVRYTVLLAGAPASTEVARQIGEWSLTLRDPGTAAKWLARAVDPARPDAGILADLAEAELGAGRTDVARAAVARGLTLFPADARLRNLRVRLGA
jgi:tetratricopeptide (TPR) repeat protein